MVSESTLNTFPSYSYFSYIDIESIVISNKMVSDSTLNTFPSSSYFSYLGI